MHDDIPNTNTQQCATDLQRGRRVLEDIGSQVTVVLEPECVGPDGTNGHASKEMQATTTHPPVCIVAVVVETKEWQLEECFRANYLRAQYSQSCVTRDTDMQSHRGFVEDECPPHLPMGKGRVQANEKKVRDEGHDRQQ